MSYSDEDIETFASKPLPPASAPAVLQSLAKEVKRLRLEIRERDASECAEIEARDKTIEAMQRKLDTREKLRGLLDDMQPEESDEDVAFRARVMRAARRWARDRNSGHKGCIVGDLYEKLGAELESSEPIPGYEQTLKAAIELLETGR